MNDDDDDDDEVDDDDNGDDYEQEEKDGDVSKSDSSKREELWKNFLKKYTKGKDEINYLFLRNIIFI